MFIAQTDCAESLHFNIWSANARTYKTVSASYNSANLIMAAVTACPDPGMPAHASRECTSRHHVHGSRCSFACHRGYRLHGKSRLACVVSDTGSTEWSHDTPICQGKQYLRGCVFFSLSIDRFCRLGCSSLPTLVLFSLCLRIFWFEPDSEGGHLKSFSPVPFIFISSHFCTFHYLSEPRIVFGIKPSSLHLLTLFCKRLFRFYLHF